MKTSTFNTIVFVAAFAVGYVVFEYTLPQFIKDGGYLVISLIALIIMLIAFVFERLFVLRKAQGTGSLSVFLKNVQQSINTGDIDGAIGACDKQRGSCANIIRSGLDRYKQLVDEGEIKGQREMMENIQRSIEEASMLEVPLLERNLVSMSTIASIATMVGLLGTTIGMIRAFNATGHAAGGVIDATSLATGISEALVNTAGGLVNAIIGIVAYNFFVNKVDSFNYTIDEASYEVIQLLKAREARSTGA